MNKLTHFNFNLYCIHTKKLSCLKSGVEFDMNDILYEFKNLHHFKDSLTFGVKAVLLKNIIQYNLLKITLGSLSIRTRS